MGHIHKHQDLNRNGYAGCIQAAWNELTLAKQAMRRESVWSRLKKASSYQFLPTPARKFVKIEIDVVHSGFSDRSDFAETRRLQFARYGGVVYTIREEQKDLIDVPRIYAVLEPAFLIAGVSPRIEEIRSQRPRISEDLSLSDALATYLEFKPELQGIKADLLDYANRLIRELEELTE